MAVIDAPQLPPYSSIRMVSTLMSVLIRTIGILSWGVLLELKVRM